MGESTKITTKTSGAKKENAISQTRKPNYSQSMNSPVDRILKLQRTTDNQIVQRMVKSRVTQTKLRIDRPGDIYEREAYSVAEKVIHMPEPWMQRQVGEEEKIRSLS